MSVGITIPIFSGFDTKYKIAQAQANYDTISTNGQSLSLDVYS
jgi:outer membrane protein TolC